MTTTESPPAQTSSSPIALRIDELMPRFDVNVVQHVVVNADPRQTYQAILDADLMDNRLTHAMVAARDVPNRLRRWRPGTAGRRPTSQATARPTFRLRDLAGEGSGW